MTEVGRTELPSYLTCYAAQIGALGRAGQRRLQRATILVVGAGGVGTASVLALATSGVGTIIVVDPQMFVLDNMNRAPYARLRDVGRPKVDGLAGFLTGRPHLRIVPVVGRAEDLGAFAKTFNLDLVVCCSNTIESRIATAAFAIGRDVPLITAGVMDGREGFGGFLSTWSPARRDLACAACFLDPAARPGTGESLLAPIVTIVGALTAWLTVRSVISGGRRPGHRWNCLAIDLRTFTFESLRVHRRQDCSTCAVQGRAPTARR